MNATQLVETLTGVSESDVTKAAKKVKAIAWARVSTDMQEARGLSIPEQLRDMREYAEKHDIEIVAEFQEAVSAFQKEARRVEFHKMIEAAKKDREVSAILVHDFSRFSRDSVNGKGLVRELRLAGIKVISLNDPDIDPDTVAGVYMEAITFAKNEAYSREVAFHTKKGCRANAQTRDIETGWCYKNGGQPIWGYKNVQLVRGEIKKGTPNIKLIWVIDDTIVQGKPVHEWVRHCLVNMAAKCASLKELRDFCNDTGLPSGRGGFWNISAWNALLQPDILLKYCGYGIWNVHRKNGTKRPPSEWIIVEDAHQALISEDEAKAIAEARRFNSTQKRFNVIKGRTQNSPYLLTGGMFRCGRCGSNMIGHATAHGPYYLCGSQPNHRGKGCGPGVYVPKMAIESDVIEGLQELMDICVDAKGFMRDVNEELRKKWESRRENNPRAKRRCDAIDAKIANIRGAIENGLMDAEWANSRLIALTTERENLQQTTWITGPLPKVNISEALAYRRKLDNLLQRGKQADKKEFLGHWIQDIKLAPEDLDVEIRFRLPEPVVNASIAGALRELRHNVIRDAVVDFDI